jgi:hypothetical protein
MIYHENFISRQQTHDEVTEQFFSAFLFLNLRRI